MLQPRVGRQAGLPGGQLDITLVEVLAAWFGASPAVIEWFANLLASLQHGDRGPLVRLDHASLLGGALVHWLFTFGEPPLG